MGPERTPKLMPNRPTGLQGDLGDSSGSPGRPSRRRRRQNYPKMYKKYIKLCKFCWKTYGKNSNNENTIGIDNTSNDWRFCCLVLFYKASEMKLKSALLVVRCICCVMFYVACFLICYLFFYLKITFLKTQASKTVGGGATPLGDLNNCHPPPTALAVGP